MSKTEKLSAILCRVDACDEAREWADGKPLREAWETCERGDWLLWIAATIGVDRKLVALAACKCARLALKHVPKGEERPLKAIQTAEAWFRSRR